MKLRQDSTNKEKSRKKWNKRCNEGRIVVFEFEI